MSTESLSTETANTRLNQRASLTEHKLFVLVYFYLLCPLSVQRRNGLRRSEIGVKGEYLGQPIPVKAHPSRVRSRCGAPTPVDSLFSAFNNSNKSLNRNSGRYRPVALGVRLMCRPAGRAAEECASVHHSAGSSGTRGSSVGLFRTTLL